MSFWRQRGADARAFAEQIDRSWTDAQREAARMALVRFCPQLQRLAAHELPPTAATLAAGAVVMEGRPWSTLADELAEIDRLPSAPLGRRLAGDEAMLGWESLLAEFDAAARRRHGVYFTPPGLAEFVAQSAAALLADELGWDAGAPRAAALRIVDPAVGSGMFLRKMMCCSSPSITAQLMGWELMPATTAAANALLSAECRPCVQWGDALQQQLAEPWFGQEAAEERDADESRILTVIGNPPWGNFGRSNRGRWILGLLQRYKRGLGERKHNLDDDFIKFFRWAEHHVVHVGRGLVALVTNSTFLQGMTHRVMRQSLLCSFDEAWFIDLGGEHFNVNPAGGDENLFAIRQGVAVSLLVRRERDRPATDGGGCRVRVAQLRGSRESKLAALAGGLHQLPWQEIAAARPAWLLAPRISRSGHYDQWPGLDELMPCRVSGVQTKRDAFFIDRCREQLQQRVLAALASPEASGQPEWLVRRLMSAGFDPQCIRPCLVTPFDRRWMYYDPGLLGRSRHAVMRHVCAGGRGLVFMRQSTNAGDYDHFLVCDALATDRVFHSRHGAPYLAPWWVFDDGKRAPNLAPDAMSRLGACGQTAERLLCYLYAVAHSPRYRRRYGEQLRRGFPRIPPAPSLECFVEMASLGEQLVEAHCQPPPLSRPLLSPPLLSPPVQHVARSCPQLIDADQEHTRVLVDGSEPWTLPTAAWTWRVGGVQVILRWLKSRRGGPLAPSESTQLVQLVDTGVRTARLCQQIGQCDRWLDDLP